MNSVAFLTLAYNTTLEVVVWTLLVPWHLAKVISGKETLARLKMRFGLVACEKKSGTKRIVIHGVSVGEVKTAEILISSLESFDAGIDVVVSTGNRDGLQIATRDQKWFQSISNVLLLPWDRRISIRRWLRTVQPDIVVVLETELWPNLFLCCRESGIPLYIVNGRIYPRDIARYRMARSFFSQVLSCADWIGVQNSDEEKHFLDLGASERTVHVVGNLKLDPLRQYNRGSDVRLKLLSAISNLLVAGSTHSPEEEWIIEAFISLKKRIRDLRIILAPRKVTRSDSLLTLVRSSGLRGTLWSTLDPHGDSWDVLILDEIGWLSSVYEYATVVVIGGTFVNHGGQNPAEAAVHGKPVVVGPSMHHFATVLELFLRDRGIVRLESHKQLESALLELLLDPELRMQLGTRARDIIDAARGGSGEYASVILRAIGAEPRQKKSTGRAAVSATTI